MQRNHSTNPSGRGIPPRFKAIWSKIVRYDAEPTGRFQVADEGARSEIERSLERFACGRDVLLDGPDLTDRPKLIEAASAAGILGIVGSNWEFVVLAADGSAWWAITEEEHEWLIYGEVLESGRVP